MRTGRLLSEPVFVLFYGAGAIALTVGERVEIDGFVPFGKWRLNIELLRSDIRRS
jgi:hypothetical protein